MALVVSNAGELILADWMLKENGENIVMKIFSSNTTPTASSVKGDFTEATFTGYSSKTLTRSSWGAATSEAGTATSAYAEQSYSVTSAQTIYGVWYETASGDYIGADRFDSSFALTNPSEFKFTPVITLVSAS